MAQAGFLPIGLARALPLRFNEDFLRKLEVLALVARRARSGKVRAERRSRQMGAGVEFADHREYAPGDDVRAMDWNLFARLDRPFVRLREEDEDLTLSLIVDHSASMGSGTPAKLELAVRIAAALGYVALAGLERVGVGLAAAGMDETMAPSRGKSATTRMLQLLENARAQGKTALCSAVRQVHAGGVPPRRGLTVLISDLLDPAGCVPALNALRAARQQIVVVQVTATDDATVPFDGELLLQDVETGEVREVEITARTRRAYSERYESLLRGIAGLCRERAIPCFQIGSHVPFEDAVLRILRSGGVLQ